MRGGNRRDTMFDDPQAQEPKTEEAAGDESESTEEAA